MTKQTSNPMDRMSVYKFRMSWGEVLRIRANLVEASAPIQMENAEGEWYSTPYQTADARHDKAAMLRLIVRYLGSEWYGPHTDVDEVVETAHSV